MPWKNDKYDYDTFDIQHANQKLEDYNKDVLDYDYYLYKNKYDKTKFKLIQRRQKVLFNPFGKSYLPLRIYKNLETNENICPVKQAIGIPKYKNCTNNLTLFIIKQIHKGKRQCDIKDMLPYCGISNQTYSNIIKNTKIEIQLPINKYEVKDYLHIDMDDCFEYLANEQGIIEKYCIRIFNYYTHKINVYKNRNQLRNKTLAYIIFKPSDNITQDKVYEFIYTTSINHYNIKLNYLTDIFWQNNNLIIAGDGALWIRAMAKWFGGKYVLDCFHGISYLWKAFINVKGKKKADTNWPNYFDTSFNFKNGNYNELINILKPNVNEKTYNYFKNNEQGIINQGKDWNIGCHAESTVSHLVKSLKGYGAKSYNYKTFVNMLNTRVAHINNQNIVIC